MIKKDFLEIFESQPNWIKQDRSSGHAASLAVVAAFWNRPQRPFISDAECRTILQLVDDAERVSALWTVNQIVAQHDAWHTFGKRFFARIWPQEARFQTSETSESLMRLAEENTDQFPAIVSVIEEFLRPVDHPDMYIYRQTGEAEGGRTLAKRWPRDVLIVLDRIIAREPAYSPDQLRALLDDIGNADPSTRSLRSWRRLRELASP
jgi:hypothetical protein